MRRWCHIRLLGRLNTETELIKRQSSFVAQFHFISFIFCCNKIVNQLKFCSCSVLVLIMFIVFVPHILRECIKNLILMIYEKLKINFDSILNIWFTYPEKNAQSRIHYYACLTLNLCRFPWKTHRPHFCWIDITKTSRPYYIAWKCIQQLEVMPFVL